MIEYKNKKELYLSGLDKFGRKESKNYMELYLADVEKNQIESNLKFNSLFSYLLQQSVDYYHENNLFKGKLFIDSGAFTAWTRGKEIDVDKYIEWINERSDFIDLYGQVDVIPGTLNEGLDISVFRNSAKKTWENYLYMRPKMKNPEGLLYTYHTGEPIEYLKQALEYTDENGKHIPYIALGGVVGNTKEVRRKFFELCFDTIKKSSNPNVKVHAFGMTDFELLQQFPITSADSTSWIMVGAMGEIMSDYGVLTISDKQKNNKSHYSHLPEDGINSVLNQVKKFGFTIEELETSRDKRIMYNAMYMIDRVSKIDNTKYTSNKKLF